jgi:hypothetical protein
MQEHGIDCCLSPTETVTVACQATGLEEIPRSSLIVGSFDQSSLLTNQRSAFRVERYQPSGNQQAGTINFSFQNRTQFLLRLHRFVINRLRWG